MRLSSLSLLRSASALPLISSLYVAAPLALGAAFLPTAANACNSAEAGSGNIYCQDPVSTDFSNVEISTVGGYSDGVGVFALAGAEIQVDGGSIHTQGNGAAGLLVYEGGSIDGRNLNIVTEGGCAYGQCYGDVPGYYPAAFGASVWGAGSITLQDSSITTSGEWAGGLVVMTGAGTSAITSEITATNVDIRTQGAKAAAIMGYNSNYMPQSRDEIFNSDDPWLSQSVTTRNLSDLLAGPGSRITVSGGSLVSEQGDLIRGDGANLEVNISDVGTIVAGSGMIVRSLASTATEGAAAVFGRINANFTNVTVVGDVYAETGEEADERLTPVFGPFDIPIAGGDSVAVVSLNNSDWQGAAIRASEVVVDASSRWLVTADSLVTDSSIATKVVTYPYCQEDCPPSELTYEQAGLGTTRNQGVIEFADPSLNGFKTLTTDNYAGTAGSTMIFNTVLGDDNSSTDLMIVTEDTAGTSNVVVRNAGGGGAQTLADGIKIIQVDGTSAGQFNLVGDYVIEGREAVIAGAYGYTLWKNGVADPQDGDWYLRSQLWEDDGTPLYQPGVPIYEAYPQVLLGLNGLPTLNQRVGNRYWNEPSAPTETVFCKDASQNFRCAVTREQEGYYQDGQSGTKTDQNGIWGFIEGTHAEFSPDVTTSQTDYDVNSWRMRAGFDGLAYEGASGDLIAGINGHYGHASADVTSLFGNGSIDTDAYGVAATATWYGNNGVYLDGQAQLTWFGSDLSSDILGELAHDNRAFGYALSIEGGKRIGISESWTLTPQAQLVYSSVDFDSFTDPSGAAVSLDKADSLAGRFGLAVEHQNSWKNADGKVERASFHAIGNLHYEFLDGTQVNVAGTGFTSKNDDLWGELGLGGTYNWGSDRYSLYGDVAASTSLASFGDSVELSGRAGLRVQW
ncbi:autotransporter outer membrane beta-barrel domain-containing protein [Kaistia terrae]|uniref:Autotransporter outer membrane beta-barrel domain-containing protein n=1 Tax=Kaistia terrae TaxID=537017 RepID=A0ABW0Q027_9HYPH|nr:autotransporter outer membrane beta-barrel domain-containing protein [Kaistia terrae]MCX5580522.1 autotransporter outer membrane beta-barrel domain-containing protein [Kaistia terrae]